MSMDLMVKAMKIKVGNPLRKLVLLKLADNASDLGECWPSFSHIAEQCEISRRSVISHIDALCEMGLLNKEHRPGVKGNSSNLYAINFSGAAVSPRGAAVSPCGAAVSPGGGAGVAPRISHFFESVKESVNEPLNHSGAPDKAAEPSCTGKQDYSSDFETAWQAYPKRAGGNSKASAFKAWKARLKEGVSPADMQAGVTRYAAYVSATGNAGSQFVKQAATFFGPDRHFEESWQAPSINGGGRRNALPVSGFGEQNYGDSDCNW